MHTTAATQMMRPVQQSDASDDVAKADPVSLIAFSTWHHDNVPIFTKSFLLRLLQVNGDDYRDDCNAGCVMTRICYL